MLRKFAVYMNAGNDRNGNPRRGWLVLDADTGTALDYVDEGYRGAAALDLAHPGAVSSPRIMVTPAERRAWMRAFSKTAS